MLLLYILGDLEKKKKERERLCVFFWIFMIQKIIIVDKHQVRQMYASETNNVIECNSIYLIHLQLTWSLDKMRVWIIFIALLHFSNYNNNNNNSNNKVESVSLLVFFEYLSFEQNLYANFFFFFFHFLLFISITKNEFNSSN